MSTKVVVGTCGIKSAHKPHGGKTRSGSPWTCDGEKITIDMIDHDPVVSEIAEPTDDFDEQDVLLLEAMTFREPVWQGVHMTPDDPRLADMQRFQKIIRLVRGIVERGC